ncbi:MAG: Asp23/Gls24 family envelope stress response protein [Clostridia bacterium]|nr:Asp23/Gls24 family envelope stress response protein [Clostridia bacterium]MBQ9480812.1 Asp23/Gls24 family envelope stress response protein [Clostridia bacterium]
MPEPKKFSTAESKGKTYYNAGIVKGIVSLAVSEVAGVAISPKGKKATKISDAIKLKFGDTGISVDVFVNVYTGYTVPDVAFNIQQNIKQSVESMSEYKISEINVHVAGVILADDEMVDY